MKKQRKAKEKEHHFNLFVQTKTNVRMATTIVVHTHLAQICRGRTHVSAGMDLLGTDSVAQVLPTLPLPFPLSSRFTHFSYLPLHTINLFVFFFYQLYPHKLYAQVGVGHTSICSPAKLSRSDKSVSFGYPD